MLRNVSIVLLVMACLLAAAPAHAGNIALTGHDDDYHCSGDPNACAQLSSLVTYAKNGSSLPVLTFDAGSELTTDLTRLGIAYTNIDPDLSGAVTGSLFNNSAYSAFIVASGSSCGGCDNDPFGEAAIAAQAEAIEKFVDNGGGVVGLAGGDSSSYYSFVPQAANSVGGAPASGYTQTSAGAKVGIPAVNGDQTHNLFYNPGTHDESKFYQIAEINQTSGNGIIPPPAAVTLTCTDCTVSGGVIIGPTPPPTVTPEPPSLLLLSSGILGVTAVLRRRGTRPVPSAGTTT